MVPAGVPDALVQKLGNEVVAIVKQPDMEQRAVQQGFRVDARGPEAFKTFLDGEVTRWAGVIQKAGIRPD